MRQVRCSARSSGTETEKFKLEYSGNNGLKPAVLEKATRLWVDQAVNKVPDEIYILAEHLFHV